MSYIILGILGLVGAYYFWEWVRPAQVPREEGGWRNIPGYERYQLQPATGEVRSFVVPRRPKDIRSSPLVLQRYTQRDELSVTLYKRNGASASFTIHEIRRMFQGGDPAGTEYNAARTRTLEPAQVDEILSALALGVDVDELAARFRVSASTIRAIRDGKTWRTR